MEAQAAADEKPGDRVSPSIAYKAQNRLPDFEEAFQEAEDYVHSLVVAGLSAKDGGVVIVGTVRDIIISDEAQALEQYWDDYAEKEKDLGEILNERPDLLMQARARLDDVPAWGEQPKLSIAEVAKQLFASGDMFDVALVEECWKHRNPPPVPEGDAERPNTAARDAAADITQSVLDDLGDDDDEQDAGEDAAAAAEALAAKIAAAEEAAAADQVVEEEAPPAEEPVDEWQETVKEQLAKVEEMLKDDPDNEQFKELRQTLRRDREGARPPPEPYAVKGQVSCYVIERHNGQMVVMPFDWCEKYRPVDVRNPMSRGTTPSYSQKTILQKQ